MWKPVLNDFRKRFKHTSSWKFILYLWQAYILFSFFLFFKVKLEEIWVFFWAAAWWQYSSLLIYLWLWFMFVNWAKNIRHERAFWYDILNSQFSLFLSRWFADLLIYDFSYLISSASASFSAAAIALQCIRIGFGFENVIN